MLEKIKTMGLLRNMLLGLALIAIVLLPFAEPQWHPEGVVELFFGAIIPATAPIIFVLMMFDLLMSHVMKSGADEAKLNVLGFITRCHLIIGGLLVVLWLFSFNRSLFL